MDRASRRSTVQFAALAILVFIALDHDATAQAWVPPSGDGEIDFVYQRISNTGHRLTDGFLVPAGQSLNMAGYIEADYAVTDRLSFSAGLPYVLSKYTDSNPPPPPFPYLPRDQCHCWHGGWQDWGLTARYNAFLSRNRSFALTPSISEGLPSHNYDFRGESVIGRDLRETRIGLDAGQRLDRVTPNLAVQAHWSYAFVERVLNIPNNRGNAGVEVNYLLFKRRLAARGFALWQRTYGGLRSGSLPPTNLLFPGDIDTPELLFQHDRLLRDNNFHAGGGLSYSFRPMDIFAAYTAYVSGTDTHAGRALTIGVSWPFELARRR